MISRRTLLALGAGVVVTACGSSSKSTSGSTPTTGTSTTEGYTALLRAPNTALTPGTVRIPVSIAGADGRVLDTGPATLTGTLLDAEGAKIAPVSAQRHGTEMLLPYWPLTFELANPGVYTLVMDGATNEASFQLFDPADVPSPTIGSVLKGFDTPTTDDARGVDPICTRSGDPCPFHVVTLTEALATQKPVVYIIGTPAHCQFGTCAPGLEYLVEVAPTYADVASFVHAEVFADNAATTVAPAVKAVGLDYEPTIVITDGTGKVVERIDIIWDREDLAALLERALS